MSGGTFPGAGGPPTRTIILRRAQESDLPALNRIMQASRAYEGEYRRILDGYAITTDQIARDHAVLAECDGEVFGFYSLITSGEPELDLLFVTDAAQGMGLGTRLFRHMRAEAGRLGLACVRIASHPPAVGFYKRMGAAQVGMKTASGCVAWDRPVLYLPIRPIS